MNILLSNDDGFDAQGIRSLFSALRDDYTLSLVAPNRDRSGCSSAVTRYGEKIVAQLKADNQWAVEGTPVDCVQLGLCGLIDPAPDMVISGINHGANLAGDVLLSGTVGAACHARGLQYPSLAVSLTKAKPVYFDTAAWMVRWFLNHIDRFKGVASVYNMNVPDLPLQSIKGVHITRLGRRYSLPVVEIEQSGLGEVVCTTTENPARSTQHLEGLDVVSVEQGYVSITPLYYDITDVNAVRALEGSFYELDFALYR